MNTIDYLCTVYKTTPEAVAEELGVTSRQLDYWKAGIEELPSRYFEKLKELFAIPDDKDYLLDNQLVPELIQGEITLIYYKKLIENLKNLRVEDSEDSNIRTANLRQLEWMIISAERQIELLNFTKEFESIIKSGMSGHNLLNEEDFRRKKIMIRGIMNILKKMLN